MGVPFCAIFSSTARNWAILAAVDDEVRAALACSRSREADVGLAAASVMVLQFSSGHGVV